VATPKGYNAASFAEKLLTEAAVLAVPGSGYGKYGDNYVRFAITIPKERITEAVQRIAKIKI
jgi:LL-diaminopimelate aminotransferase